MFRTSRKTLMIVFSECFSNYTYSVSQNVAPILGCLMIYRLARRDRDRMEILSRYFNRKTE